MESASPGPITSLVQCPAHELPMSFRLRHSEPSKRQLGPWSSISAQHTKERFPSPFSSNVTQQGLQGDSLWLPPLGQAGGPGMPIPKRGDSPDLPVPGQQRQRDSRDFVPVESPRVTRTARDTACPRTCSEVVVHGLPCPERTSLSTQES